MASPTTAYTAVPQSHAPPPGAPAGGQWGKNTYKGDKTKAAACVGCLCLCLPGLFILCFPFDERDVYMASDGTLYDASGRVVGNAHTGKARFTPTRGV